MVYAARNKVSGRRQKLLIQGQNSLKPNLLRPSQSIMKQIVTKEKQ